MAAAVGAVRRSDDLADFAKIAAATLMIFNFKLLTVPGHFLVYLYTHIQTVPNRILEMPGHLLEYLLISWRTWPRTP